MYSSWECLSPEGFALNSKWNEAEKYICNPLSGEVPMECLSAKTLSGRSFRNLTNRITMSAPLVYSHSSCHFQTKSSRTVSQDIDQFPERKAVSLTRDVGIQSTPPDLCSGSLSPASTPPILERTLKRCGTETGDSTDSNTKSKANEQVQVKETRENEETKKDEEIRQPAGCLSCVRKKQRNKHKSGRKSIFCFPSF
nr:hypothetical protein B456_001G080100 [Gossypium raimondii]